jgi:hypothetical protein
VYQMHASGEKHGNILVVLSSVIGLAITFVLLISLSTTNRQPSTALSSPGHEH